VTEPGSQSSPAGFRLSHGDRLGPYEIVGPLDGGGQGEVYRAHDPRLRRDVAIKVLHQSGDATAGHVTRLLREARAAGSLNHPNIVAVLDVGTEGDLPYVVSELLKGETLRSRLTRSPLPYRKVLDYGIQIAEALGAAHERGIWHRDVKPSNAFITTEGRIKLLDFGLVKLRASDRSFDSQGSTADVEDTKPGGVRGTIGYMSPEQVLGEVVDHRTDLFALGAVLYEMLSGVPAFRRATTVETTRAVLNEEPASLLERNPKLPPLAVAVVQRCLEKNREERYQSALDLAFQLRQLLESHKPPVRPLVRPLGLVLAILAAAVLAGAVLILVKMLRQPPPSFEQLTFHRGRIGGARFASEGGAVVYSEAREDRPQDVWWLSGPNSPESLRPLGYTKSDVLAVRNGKLALSLNRRFVMGERFVGTLAEAPIGQGSPRELVPDVEDADWDLSGNQCAVARSTGAAGRSRLEYPAGHVLFESTGSIRHPRFSRDGRRIAFLEDPTGRGAGGRVVLVDLDGHATPLTKEWPSAHGLAWSRTGSEVWFAAGASRTNRALRAVGLDHRERLILEVPASLTVWDIALDGRVLLTRDDERSALLGVPPGQTGERDLSWFDSSGLSDLSEDGRTLLFADRFGVYTRATDGSPPVRLGVNAGFGDGFSPDGQRVLVTTASGNQLVVLPAGLGGDSVLLPTHGITSYRGALWFPDGRRILFNGMRPGENLRAYVQGLQGDPPSPLTPENVWVLSISPDGEWAAAIRPDQGISLWPVAGGAPRLVPSSRPGDRPVAWSADGRSLWIFHRGEVPAEVSLLAVASGHRQVWKKISPPDPSGVYSISDFKITKDGGAYFYSYKRVLSQLYAASGLR
jgi:serine/threonine protein kinase